jgi:hypothetical protein
MTTAASRKGRRFFVGGSTRPARLAPGTPAALNRARGRPKLPPPQIPSGAISSVGRALPLHGRCRRFESVIAYQFSLSQASAWQAGARHRGSHALLLHRLPGNVDRLSAEAGVGQRAQLDFIRAGQQGWIARKATNKTPTRLLTGTAGRRALGAAAAGAGRAAGADRRHPDRSRQTAIGRARR